MRRGHLFLGAAMIAQIALAQTASAQDVVMRRPLPAASTGTTGTGGTGSGGQAGGGGQSPSTAGAHWVVGDATVTPSCSASAQTTATVTCRNSSDQALADTACTDAKPSATGTTADYSTCSYTWVDGDWSDYNSACAGYSTRSRQVSCIREDGSDTVVDDSHCDPNSPDARKVDTVGNQSQCTNVLTVITWNGIPGYNFYPNDAVISNEQSRAHNVAPNSLTNATFSPSGYSQTFGAYTAQDLLGVLNVAQDGDYTVTISADDAGRILIDGTLVVESSFNGGLSRPNTATIHLTPGAHNYEAFAYQLGGDQFLNTSIAGAGAASLVFTPGTTSQNIADYSQITSQLSMRRWNGISYNGPDQAGLDYVYGQVMSRMPDSVDQEPNIPGELTIGAGGSSAFDAAGTLTVKTGGAYTFTLNADDAGKIVIDGNVVVQSGYSGQLGPTTATITLTPGAHRYEAFGYQGNGSQYFTATIDGPDTQTLIFSPS